MSGQTREIIVTSALAVIIALGIGIGVYFTQPLTSSLTTKSSTSTIYSHTSSSSATSSSAVQGACATQYTPSLNESRRTTVVMATNSTSELCVTIYDYNYSNDNITETWSGPPNMLMLKNGSWSQQAVNLTVSIQPNIDIAPNANGSFVFRIVPQSGTHAIYNLGLPDVCSTLQLNYLLVLAVGYSTTEVQAMRSVIQGADSGTYTGCSGLMYEYANITGITDLAPVFTA